MKHFLMSIIFVSTGVFAFANPFNLKENLQKIDQDQDILLSALKEMADKKAVENNARKEQSVAKNNEITEAKRTEEYRRIKEKRLSAIKKEKDKIDQARVKEAENIVAKKREAKRLEVEAYEKERAENLAKQAEDAAILAKEKLADERKNKKLPKELSFFQKLIEAKTEGKHRPLEGELKNILESIVKEKNNPNYTVDDVKNEFDSLKDNKEIGMMLMTYMIAKSVILQESMDSDEIEKFDAKFQKASFDKNNMERILEKYPNELRELGFNFLEDVLTNGIPQMDLNMSFNMTASSDGEVQIDIGNKEVNQEEKSKIVDINTAREATKAKAAADIAYEKAVKEMDMED